MSKIDASTKVVGLIGDPVEGSFSPYFQNLAIETLDLNYRYLAFPVKEGTVKQAVLGAAKLGIQGLNVTAPHKAEVAKIVDELSSSAEAISAVNTLYFGNQGKLIGENTDWIGFTKALNRRDFDPTDSRCLVFGAGGAAAGVVYGLLRRKADRVVVANRTLKRARSLVNRLGEKFEGPDLLARPLKPDKLEEEVRNAQLVVNATPVGMGEKTDRSVWNRPETFRPDQLVFDLIYNPNPTKFLSIASEGGAETLGGLDMLLLQGLESLKLWTGKDFISEKLATTLVRELNLEVET